MAGHELDSSGDNYDIWLGGNDFDLPFKLKEMDVNDVSNWFKSLDIGDWNNTVSVLVEEEGICGDHLLSFDENDFVELGIPESGEERKQFDKKFTLLQSKGYRRPRTTTTNPTVIKTTAIINTIPTTITTKKIALTTLTTTLTTTTLITTTTTTTNESSN
jgi:hypothetical protein